MTSSWRAASCRTTSREGRGVRGTSTINPMLNYLESRLNELLTQGKVNYNVAALVDRLPVSKAKM